MPSYGVTQEGGTLRPWSWAERVLREAHNVWVCTVRPDGRPHAMPVWGVWDGEAFWFSSAAESRKAKNLAQRADCSVGAELGTAAVVLEGAAECVAPASAPPEVARAYAAKYDGGYPEDSPLFRVAPRVVFGFSEAGEEFAETATRWTFERA